MTSSENERGEDLIPEVPATDQPVDADQGPDEVDAEPTPEDGPQDVDQEPGYEEAEGENDDPDDPAVHEVG